MTKRYPFQCSECAKEMLLELATNNRKIMCHDCTIHEQHFNGYLDQFKAELPFPDKQYTISRIIEYSFTINNYADSLKINKERNVKFFEKFIGMASDKKPTEYEYQKLKSDVYDQCNFVIKEEDEKIYNMHHPSISPYEEYATYQDRMDVWIKNKNQISEAKRKHLSVLELIKNPAEYLNISIPSELTKTESFGIFKNRTKTESFGIFKGEEGEI